MCLGVIQGLLSLMSQCLPEQTDCFRASLVLNDLWGLGARRRAVSASGGTGTHPRLPILKRELHSCDCVHCYSKTCYIAAQEDLLMITAIQRQAYKHA